MQRKNSPPAVSPTAADIAAALGAARRSGQWWSCRCPAHHDRSPSLSVCDGNHGPIVRCWAGCDPRDVVAELHRRGLIGRGNARDRAPTKVRGDDRGDAAKRIEIARRIWDAAGDASRSPVARYLAGRAIAIPLPPSLRYTPALRRPDGSSGPAMIARIDSIDGEVIGVHRTWLGRGAAGHWKRIDRAMLGRTAGGAVRLAPAAETLMVGEGVETCLAAMQATGLEGWAALSTSGLMALVLPPLPLAATVVILADSDASGAGERAARSAAARWLSEGRRVRIAMPPRPGDFNDVLMGRGDVERRDVAA